MSNVFLAGEKIDLCVPQECDFEQWASWFNSQEVTKHLEQGKYPNTPTMQRDFYEQSVRSGRFLTLVKTKDGDLLGVVSISEIDHEKASCQTGTVCPVKSKKAPLAALEAVAMVTQHAFERLGMHIVWAGHAYPGLKRWIHKREMLGFRTYGVMPDGFRHGIEVTDTAKVSITKETFLQLKARRGGSLWPGEETAIKIIKAMKGRRALVDKVDEAVKRLHREGDDELLEIERGIEF